MTSLQRKLVRDLVRLWPQVLAISMVMAAGAATLILGIGAHASLDETRAAYYERNRFADIFADLTRAPRSLEGEIGELPGVAAVETRVAKIALLDLPGVAEPVSAMMISIPTHREQTLNFLHLRRGRMPLPGDDQDVVVSEPFALAHRFEIGTVFDAILNGRKRTLRVVGTALSPEFIYTIGPGDLMPDDRRFGIVWMQERPLAAAYDLTDSFSNVQLKLVRDASVQDVIGRLNALLVRFGGRGAYGRHDQTSHAFLDAELNQLQAISRILPPIFLVVAAFLVNMTLSRLITLEREQIGLLKALGYSNRGIGAHYLQFAISVACVGAIVGMLAGTWLGHGLTRLYADFFRFPFLVFHTDTAVYVLAAGATLVSAGVGALKATRDVVVLAPAVAMSPPAPTRYRRLLPTRFYSSLEVPQSFVMAARHVTRWPYRSLSSTVGISLSVALLVGSLWSFGSTEFMIDVTFHRTERQHATLSFISERPISALYEIQALPSVMAAEPYRSVPVNMKHLNVERRITLSGKVPDATLNRVVDRSLTPARLPESGIALSKSLARILGVTVGDVVEVELLERDWRRTTFAVTQIIEGYLGLTAYMSLPAMNQWLREGSLISGVHLLYDATQQDDLFRRLKATPETSFVALQRVSLQKFRDTLAQNLLFMITVYVVLGMIISFGVVYNFARISLSEQARELASLRVLGFHKSEVAAVLFGELAALVIVAQPAGWILGYGFANLIVRSFESELYQVPLIVERSVYGVASLIVFAAALASALVVRRRIDRLDIVEVLKTRE